MGRKEGDKEALTIAYANNGKDIYGYLRILGGKQLNIFTDKLIFPGELTVNTLNGIAPSTISLNTHNHDVTYSKIEHAHLTNDITDINTLAKADHNHDNAYSKLVHTHKYNDLENNYFKIKSETKEGRGHRLFYCLRCFRIIK